MNHEINNNDSINFIDNFLFDINYAEEYYGSFNDGLNMFILQSFEMTKPFDEDLNILDLFRIQHKINPFKVLGGNSIIVKSNISNDRAALNVKFSSITNSIKSTVLKRNTIKVNLK